MSTINNVFSFNRLKSAGELPDDSQLLTDEDISKRCTTVTDFKKLSDDERIGHTNRVIADNALWVAEDKLGMFSLDNEGFLWRTSAGNRTITKFLIKTNVNGDFIKIPSGLQTLIYKGNNVGKTVISKKRGENTMPKLSADALKEQLNNLGNQEGAVDPKEKLAEMMKNSQQPMTNFTSDTPAGEKTAAQKEAEKEQKKAAHASLVNGVTKNTKNVQVGNNVIMNAFANKFGELIGYVVVNDSKIDVTTPNRFVLNAEGKKQLKHGVTEAKSSRDYITRPELVIKEKAPSKPVGVIFSVPEGAITKPSEFYNSNGEVQFDSSKTNLVIKSLPFDEAFEFIGRTFGPTIKESATTHGVAGNVMLLAESYMKTHKIKDEITNEVVRVEQTPATKYYFKSNSRKRLVIPTNYIPQKTFQTRKLSEILSGSEEVKTEMNKALFFKVFTKKDGVSKYDNFSNEDQSKIKAHADDNGNITGYSSIFINGGVPMNVASYMDSKAMIADPAIPVKVFKTAKTTGNESAVFVSYDVLNPKEDLAALNPQTNPKFSAMVKAMGNLSVVDAVKACVKKKPRVSETSTKIKLDLNDGLKLLYKQANGELAGVESDSKFDKSSLDNMYKLVAEQI